jgi:transcriptional regulator NrdR family protein
MVCIYCGNDTKVTNSRDRARNPSVWRRRTCLACVAQFTTNELPDYSTALLVLNTERKHSTAFSRDKLFLSLYKSLGHRRDSLNSATELTNTIIGRVLHKKLAPSGAISPQALAKISYDTLKRYDPLAAHNYKAYHQAALKRSN